MLLFVLLFLQSAGASAADTILPGTLVHPLQPKIAAFLARQAQVRDFPSSGLSRKDYLRVIDGQVTAMRNYQNSQGRIVDPVIQAEFAFATPCYAHAASVLLASGYRTDAGLRESALRAMDVAISDMAAGEAPNQHGDFFTYPVMLALEHLRTQAAPSRVARWMGLLGTVRPVKLYRVHVPGGNNWNLVNASGEFLRARRGLTGPEYVEACLRAHVHDFSGLGMFNEAGNPLAYDHFSRYFLAGILDLGYRGALCDTYRDLIWKGSWTSLFMQSPSGELAAGFRSSHHIWNEAEAAAIYEIYAGQYARVGRPAEAGAFKRAAMLSLDSIRRWIRPDGSGYIVKNRYPIKARFGYEDYSQHTTYNMLACSMLAAAWQFADDSIAERPAPADIGGFVLPVLEPFHKIFASAGGSYIEYDTRGDHIYDPTGLIRVHFAGGNPQLGPSDGCAAKFSGKGVNIAVGPAWKEANGIWRSLAEMTPGAANVEVLSETPAEAAFQVTLAADALRITEIVRVRPGEVTVDSRVSGVEITAMRIWFPMLVFDGLERSKVDVAGDSAGLELRGGRLRFTIVEPAGVEIHRSDRRLMHRNGMMEPVYGEFRGAHAVFRIKAW